MTQLYLNSQRRLVMFDSTEHTMNSVVYRNDGPKKGDIILDEVTDLLIDRLISTGSLSPITETISR